LLCIVTISALPPAAQRRMVWRRRGDCVEHDHQRSTHGRRACFMHSRFSLFFVVFACTRVRL